LHSIQPSQASFEFVDQRCIAAGPRAGLYRPKGPHTLPNPYNASGFVAKQYIWETIDDPKALCDSKILDTPGFTLIISWLSQKWLQKCQKLAPRGTKNPDQHLSKEQQTECLNSAAAELIREITQRQLLN